MNCTDTFRTPPYRHNCAQAVAYKYASLLGISPEEALERFATCAAGRAPGGLCGALYAAQQLAPSQSDAIRERFAQVTGGHLACSDIKGLSGTPCPVCVDTIDKILASLCQESKTGREL